MGLTLAELISLACAVIGEGGTVLKFWEDKKLGALKLTDRVVGDHQVIVVTAFPADYDWGQAAIAAGIS